MSTCQKGMSITIGGTPHGPPNGPLQLDGATLATINGAMDFVFACSGIPAHHLTGLMPNTGPGTWVEDNGFGSSLVVGGGPGFEVTIDFQSNSYNNDGSLSAFPIGSITWGGAGAILTNCGYIPGFPLVGGSVAFA